MKHTLKIIPKYFKHVVEDRKNFEIRKNDREYKVGDTLVLNEFSAGQYSGQNVVKTINYVFDDPGFGLEPGYCILGFE